MKSTLSFCLFLSISAATAHAENEAWVEQAKAFVKTLSRPVDVYTYDKRASLGIGEREAVLPKDPRVASYLSEGAMTFNNVKEKLDQQGPNGIYVATGPFVSREWGADRKTPNFNGTDWALVRITLPAGTRFFDGRMRNAFPPALQKFISSFGCGAITMEQLLTVKDRPHDARQCWQAYTRMVPALQVQMVAKYFFAVGPSFCPVHNSQITDFIIVDPQSMTNYGVYVAEIPTNDDNTERSFIRDFWLLAKQQVASACGAFTPVSWNDRFSDRKSTCPFYVTSPNRFATPWPQLPQGKMSPPALFEQKIFGCGKYREDSP